MKKQQTYLWVGDLVMISLVTLVGFATHGTLLDAGWRMLTTFIPLALAWVIVGLPSGLLDVSQALQGKRLWRPVWGMIAAGPLAVLIRSLLLANQPIIPVFAWVIIGVSAASFLVWRLVFYLLFRVRES